MKSKSPCVLFRTSWTPGILAVEFLGALKNLRFFVCSKCPRTKASRTMVLDGRQESEPMKILEMCGLSSTLTSKKAQGWGFDLSIGFVIFAVAIVSFYFFAVNYPADSEEDSQTLLYEAGLIGDSLLSEGSPVNWTVDNVVRIGIISNGKINKTKLESFKILNYENTKILFNVRHDYIIDFSDEEIDIIGDINFDFDADNVVKVVRVSSYEGKPITLSIYLSD